jgi:Uma2 family endonuclease
VALRSASGIYGRILLKRGIAARSLRMAAPAVDIRRWTREDYERLVEEGYFRPNERVELVDGIIFEMTPQNSWHAAAIQALQEVLLAAFKKGFSVRFQLPLALSVDSEPEPDVAVVPGHWRDYREAHPTTAVLVVEVAESALVHDRARKTAVYAHAGIPEYWILNRGGACLEVYRDPSADRYRSRAVLKPGETVSPLARPRVSIPIADLLP